MNKRENVERVRRAAKSFEPDFKPVMAMMVMVDEGARVLSVSWGQNAGLCRLAGRFLDEMHDGIMSNSPDKTLGGNGNVR
jgi:hypothetical protein